MAEAGFDFSEDELIRLQHHVTVDYLNALRDDYEGSFERFWEDFRSRPAFSKKEDGVLLNVWCMAACYSTDDDGTVRLPFDVATGKAHKSELKLTDVAGSALAEAAATRPDLVGISAAMVMARSTAGSRRW